MAALVHSGHELGAFMGKHCVTHILAREDGGSSQPPCLQGAAGAAWQSPWAAGWQLASGDVVTGSTAVKGRDGGSQGMLCAQISGWIPHNWEQLQSRAWKPAVDAIPAPISLLQTAPRAEKQLPASYWGPSGPF